ncbi:hypothetical protein HDE74_001861 [Janthinobacterium sp. K2Li3]|nr:hypothetical protein [Janthinobacterium sp. K2C7]MBB5381148.1 hypothetical protein [Janthinobacterium sp. K2Li3]MBB5387699.1 hypothetical protein [Janthinobacterium sp. K2E3]
MLEMDIPVVIFKDETITSHIETLLDLGEPV